MALRFRLVSVLILGSVFSGNAQGVTDSLLTIFQNELQREVKEFKAFPQPPYFIAYRFSDLHNTSLRSSFGSLVVDNTEASRVFAPEVRIGNYRFDDSHEAEDHIGMRMGEGGGRYAAPLPRDNRPEPIQLAIWQGTQLAYRVGLERYKEIRKNPKDTVSVIPDFSREKPSVYSDGPLPDYASFFDRKLWSERIKTMTVPFLKVPDIVRADASIDAATERNYFISSEGSAIAQNRTFVYLTLSASIRAEDGDVLPLTLSWYASDPSKLPSQESITAEVAAMIEKLKRLRTAPIAEPYTGPAILQARAAGVFFHEIFGHRIEGHRLKNSNDGQTFKTKINELVLPKTLSVISDPTRTDFGSQALNGFYRYDDEGTKAEKVTIVQDGVLKNFLMSRTPIEGFPVSNGHGRGNLRAEAVSRQSNLIVENTKDVPMAQLRKMLISQCEKEKKKYGYLFMDVVGGFTTTNRDMPNAFNIFPTEVYRIYTDGRPDELVRGVDLIGTPLAMFAGITAADSKSEVFTGFCGAESGSIPVTAISPSFFVKRIETQKKSVVHSDTPLLPIPH